jgi:uncharacterized protein
VRSIHSLANHHPIKFYLSAVLTLSWVSIPILIATRLPVEIDLIILTYVGLLGMAVLITYLRKGREGVKEYGKRIFRWRVGIGYYLFALFAFPVVNYFIAQLSGDLQRSESFLSLITNTGVSLLSGFLIINLWEEAGWAGFMQTHLMRTLGILKGSLLTAPAFAAIHLPLLLQERDAKQLLLTLGVLFGLALFFRYLIGMMLEDTGGSIIIVGLLHASFNSVSSIGDYPIIWTTIILTIVYALFRKFTSKKESKSKGKITPATSFSKR